MTPLSVAIITLNEERNIGRCLDALQGIADDIVVIDSFSTDRTGEICRQKGARFIPHKFEGNIEQWTFAMTQTQYPHVLALDADEVLSEELRQAILALKTNWQADGYTFNRLTNYCGSWIRHGGWYPDRKLRVFDKRKATWGGVNPHGQVIMNEGTTTAHLKGDLLHYSFYSTWQHVSQVNNYSESGAKAAVALGRRSSTAHIIFASWFKFVKSYFLQLGMLDGYHGFIIAAVSAFATFVKYVKMKEIQAQKIQ